MSFVTGGVALTERQFLVVKFVHNRQVRTRPELPPHSVAFESFYKEQGIVRDDDEFNATHPRSHSQEKAEGFYEKGFYDF